MPTEVRLVVLLLLVTVIVATYMLLVLPRQFDRRVEDLAKVLGRVVDLRSSVRSTIRSEIRSLSVEVGSRLGFSPKERRRLSLASELCDIGLVLLPYRFLNGEDPNPSAQTRAAFARHGEVGAELLERTTVFKDLGDIVRMHDKNFGDVPQAPVESRVLRVVVQYVTLASVHGGADALRRMKAEPSGRYDPEILLKLESVVSSSA